MNIKYTTANAFNKKRSINKGISLAKEATPKLAKKATKYYFNKGINELYKIFTSSKGSGIILTNNEIRDIMKVIKSLENRGIVLKETTKNLLVKKEDF